MVLDQAEAKANPITIKDLMNNGIQIRIFSKDKPLGLSMGLFDSKTFILSSSSWTHYSFVINHELSVKVPSPTATEKLVELFNQDWAASKENS